MEQSPKRLFLLDAYALIYRAHFAFTKSPRINSKGHNTSVAFGFTNTLLEVLQKQKPTHIAVAFDTAGPTFRDEIYESYKATRQEMPEDIRYGIPKVKEIIRGFNIPIIEKEGFEADDIIGTLAVKAESIGYEVYMMTPDKDFGQLVNESIFLYKPAYMGNVVDVMGVKEVCEKWDIENVSQVRDILGLQGDSSDNIPGIPGFGPKTAATLLKKYKSVENIVAHAGELKGKQKELVETYGEQAILSKKLATIVTDVPVEFDEDELTYNGPDAEILKPIFTDLEFKTISARVFNESGTSAPKPKISQLSMFDGAPNEEQSVDEVLSVRENFSKAGANYKVVTTEQERASLVKKLSSQKILSMEILSENLSSDPVLQGISFSYAEGEAFFTPVNNKNEAESIIKDLQPIFESVSIKKVGHNLKAAILALKIFGSDLKGAFFDTMLAHYLIEPEASHELSILCGEYLQYDLLPNNEENISDQACERVDKTLQLTTKLEKELIDRTHAKLMHDVEMPLVTGEIGTSCRQQAPQPLVQETHSPR
jgi:DNA polymerase-1